jgi:F0F1-type ATP synthase assembly protein I
MSEPEKRPNDYLHYSSAGIQMVLTILFFTYLGTRLDKHFESKPLWTAILAIFGVVIAMIFMVRAFMNPPSTKKKKQGEKKDEENKAE